ncbi:orotidine-5'-phosphate decarboxylase [Clostridium saccharobutylicum]|uniref:Orotidine 5'-phosphate decarboxylase n=1 Tax=Clostridium saccharobutylicum DSM 13864 TaxID=1345695 RepID=U5MRF1_CLOSA|nr:orotidine-5'-phosphate decarboxylase [Clostridium saccharobutylicum]AGX42251.1 orotidine 5'-phosphate decarboxylase PyrF [Clostridium saccharobutylicum DSM 13864]AQR89532.1 orotidine 5'-phosphate decarboxylase [Clostridium saccharobutylicum]AQR99434.1 orotidine 5'-phosphate decarboxylase [Clostridium saccharobutylicum]AQS09165.1 orotidine 5'-phosphate decarboxylase [Clostridium saccharobutylicum]AQS13420.1 orotidine 5'-phosphate decarboxylase [Clostridium saccharobutylicum]
MTSYIIDKLYDRVEKRGVVCVGLDTALDYVPEHIKNGRTPGEAIFEFNKQIIDSTYDVAACFKVQIAYYEALGIEGLVAYKNTLDYLREKDEIIIADIKRGDIAATAKMYAKAHFEGDFEADFITLSPYMGMDSIEPYLPYLEKGNKGVFSLVRTSNPGAEDIEYLDTTENKKVFEIVADKITEMAKNCVGECGYTAIGGVIGCTHVEEGKKIRANYNNMFFLIPGYGAQGGTAEDVALYLNNGNGGVVNSSRGILLAYKKANKPEEFALCAREEAIKMRDAIRKAVKEA